MSTVESEPKQKPKRKVTDVVTDWVAGAPKDAPLRIKVAAWLLTIAGLALFSIVWELDERYYGGDHISLLSGAGIVIILTRAAVVKWGH